MIGSIKHKGLKRLYDNNERKLIRPDLAERCADLLAMLDAATVVEDLDRPSLRLHQLTGELKGYWSITVRANWRVIFHFKDGTATDIELIDDH